ncbi:MAG: flagellar hook-length control protein FliK [Deferribacteraceae bacterium]|jgi:flagellar hook-length control protein FliK|nr:flagellar hook-length control protein FliK [Deferribacteraceae bacterium]
MNNIDPTILNLTETKTVIPAVKSTADTERANFRAILSSIMPTLVRDGKSGNQNGKIIPQDIKNVYTATVKSDAENNSPVLPLPDMPILSNNFYNNMNLVQAEADPFFETRMITAAPPVLSNNVNNNNTELQRVDKGQLQDMQTRLSVLISAVSGGQSDLKYVNNIENSESAVSKGKNIESVVLNNEKIIIARDSKEDITEIVITLDELKQILSVLVSDIPSEEKEKLLEDIRRSLSEKTASAKEIMAVKPADGYTPPLSGADMYISSDKPVLTKETSVKKILTSEIYMANRDEILQAVKDILAWISSGTYTENKGVAAENNRQENDGVYRLLPETELSSPVFSGINAEMMAVMPSKTTLSMAAAESSVEPINDSENIETGEIAVNAETKTPKPVSPKPAFHNMKSAQPAPPAHNEPVLKEQVVKEQMFNRQINEPVSNQFRSAEKTEPFTVIHEDNKEAEVAAAAGMNSKDIKDIKIERFDSELNNKATDNITTEKPMHVTGNKPDNNSGKEFAQAETHEKTDTFIKKDKERGNPKVSFTMDKSAQETEKPKTAHVKHSVFEEYAPAEKREANPIVKMKSDSVQQRPEARQTETVLKWESAKDAVNLAKIIQQAGQNGATKLTVRLYPEHLGRLEIQLTEIGGRIDAKMMANSQESRNLLASHGDAIRQQLMDRGIHIDNMNFTFHDAFARQEQERQEQQQTAHRHGNTGRNGGGKDNEGKEEINEERGQEGLYA